MNCVIRTIAKSYITELLPRFSFTPILCPYSTKVYKRLEVNQKYWQNLIRDENYEEEKLI